MPLAATRAPYTLFIVDDDMPLNPREDYDCLGKMVCWHGRYRLGDQHNFSEPRDFLQELLFSEYSSGHGRNNPVFEFLKSGKARDAKFYAPTDHDGGEQRQRLIAQMPVPRERHEHIGKNQ